MCGQRQGKAAGAAIVVAFPKVRMLNFISLWLLQPMPPWSSCRFQTCGSIAQGCIVQLGKKIGTKNIVKPSELPSFSWFADDVTAVPPFINSCEVFFRLFFF